MAYTTDDQTALQRALVSGELRVAFSDGRSVEYRSIREIKEALAVVNTTLNASSGKKRIRQVQVNMEPGF
jgi:hypothetical protein